MSEKESPSKFLTFSHRCRGFSYPENSMKAMQAVLSSTLDGVEVDIRLTKDHKWIVMHNPFFKSEERAVVRVHERTYAQIKREVMLLDTFLAAFAALGTDKQLMIDVKDIGELRSLVKLVQQYALKDRVIIIGWDPEIARRVHAYDRTIRVGLSYVPLHSSLSFFEGSMKTPLSRHKIIMQFNNNHSFDMKQSLGLTHQHYLSYIPDLPLYSIQVPGMLCSTKLVQHAHEKGIKVFPFGVHTRLGLALLKRRGVDGILTDHPKHFEK